MSARDVRNVRNAVFDCGRHQPSVRQQLAVMFAASRPESSWILDAINSRRRRELRRVVRNECLPHCSFEEERSRQVWEERWAGVGTASVPDGVFGSSGFERR